MAGQIEIIRDVPTLPRRARDGHKGSYGHVLVVGGSQGMIGAVALAANAALRAGAGLVTFAAPRSIQPLVATLCPCATSLPLPTGDDGELAPQAADVVLEYAGRCGVVALGPGLGVGPSQRRLVEALLGQDRPLAIDADGLNNLAAVEDWPNRRRCELVLTPHPGEFSRLTGVATADVQARRAELATAHARKWAAAGHRPSGTADRDHPLVLVLKGAGTVVTDGARIYTNDTGNPGMATGGTGDVLTGLVAGLLAQVAAHKLSAMQAAMLAVWSHGRAGDLAAAELGETSLIATDLLEYLPKALCERGG